MNLKDFLTRNHTHSDQDKFDIAKHLILQTNVIHAANDSSQNLHSGNIFFSYNHDNGKDIKFPLVFSDLANLPNAENVELPTLSISSNICDLGLTLLRLFCLPEFQTELPSNSSFSTKDEISSMLQPRFRIDALIDSIFAMVSHQMTVEQLRSLQIPILGLERSPPWSLTEAHILKMLADTDVGDKVLEIMSPDILSLGISFDCEKFVQKAIQATNLLRMEYWAELLESSETNGILKVMAFLRDNR